LLTWALLFYLHPTFVEAQSGGKALALWVLVSMTDLTSIRGREG
jgi:hypothetical protein